MESTENEQPRTWRFGAFRLDVGLRELRRDGQAVKVQPRVFDLLVYLAQNRDRAIDKDELQDAVWPGLFITETALTRAVMKARQAVGDDASRQAVIRTVHGHGYRFVAELDSSEFPDTTPVDDHAPPGADRAGWRLGGVLLAVLLLAAAWFSGREQASRVTRLAVLPVAAAEAGTELAWTSFGLMALIGAMIESGSGVPVVAPEDVVALHEAGPDGLHDRLVSEFGVSHLLELALLPGPQGLVLDYTLSTPDGEVARGRLDGESATGLAHEVVREFTALSARPPGPAPTVAAISQDAFVNEGLSRGLDAALRGDCATAIPLLRVIIDQAPGLFLPRYRLVNCHLQRAELTAAAELLSSLVRDLEAQGTSRQLARALTAEAELAFLEGDPARAVTLMERAYQLSGAEWRDAERSDLARYRNAAGQP